MRYIKKNSNTILLNYILYLTKLILLLAGLECKEDNYNYKIKTLNKIIKKKLELNIHFLILKLVERLN